MTDPTTDKIAGTLLCQELLVRHLEECGVLERASFRTYLEAHLMNLTGSERHQTTYGPMRALIAALGK